MVYMFAGGPHDKLFFFEALDANGTGLAAFLHDQGFDPVAAIEG